MKSNTKKAVIFSCLSLLFITSIIVYAVVYQSNDRENKFNPAKAEIQIKESGNPEETQTSEYTGATDAAGNFNVVKTVQIYDVRNKNDEYLRVRFIPMWYDSDGNVVGGADEFSDFSHIDLVGNELQFKKSDNSTVLLRLKLSYTDDGNPENDWSNEWRYDSSDQCFYYKGKIQSGDISAILLSGAQIPKAVYDATKDQYTLHIEVLADAIQSGGDAKNDRWVNP